jgi:hypothetical protein
MENMKEKYPTPREFVRHIDQQYMLYIAVPILGFFAYYIYFLRNVGRGQLDELEISPLYLSIYVLAWILPVIYIILQKKKHKTEIRSFEDINKQMEVYEGLAKKEFMLITIFFIVSIFGFVFSNNHMMSLPVWFLFIVSSIEKPSIFKLVKLFKFPSKEAYDKFLKDEWA